MSLDNICVSESLHLNMDINHDIVLYTIQYFSAKQDLFPATDKVKECQCKVFTYNGWLVRLIHAAKSCNCSQYWYITLITQHLQQAICYVIPTTTAECANTHHKISYLSGWQEIYLQCMVLWAERNACYLLAGLPPMSIGVIFPQNFLTTYTLQSCFTDYMRVISVKPLHFISCLGIKWQHISRIYISVGDLKYKYLPCVTLALTNFVYGVSICKWQKGSSKRDIQFVDVNRILTSQLTTICSALQTDDNTLFSQFWKHLRVHKIQ